MIDGKEGLALLIESLDRLQIPYYVGGSLASSLYGVWRQTSDVDLVADIRMEQVDPFALSLQTEFYADAEMMKAAILRGRSFNVIHFRNAYKFDIFPAQHDAFQESQMRRRTLIDASIAGLDQMIQAASVEDTILSKLLWYRSGGGISDQKWHDLLGIVKVRGGKLDLDYLRHWARYLKVEDLLDELLVSL